MFCAANNSFTFFYNKQQGVLLPPPVIPLLGQEHSLLLFYALVVNVKTLYWGTKHAFIFSCRIFYIFNTDGIKMPLKPIS